MELNIHVLEPDQAVATYGPVNIRIIHGARTDLADIDHARALIEAALSRYPVVGVAAFVHHGSPIPGGVVRRHANEVFGSYGDRLVLVHCMLGLGFWATAARAAAAAVSKLSGGAPVVGSVEDAAERLCGDLILDGLDTGRFVGVYEDLMNRMHAHASVA